MKKFLLSFIIFLSLYSACFGYSRSVSTVLNKSVKITYNNRIQQFRNVQGVRVYPITYEGTTYLPVRAISSLFRQKIKWDGNTNSVHIGEGDLDTISSEVANFFIADNNESIDAIQNEDVTIYYQGQVQTFRDVTGKVVYPISYEGTTYLPVRAISNLFEAEIGWDGNTNTVSIVKEINVPVIKVQFNKAKAEVEVGKSINLTATVIPPNATNKAMIWESSNESVASVSNGKIVGKQEGSCSITVKSVDGNKIAACTITVKTKEDINKTIDVSGGISFNKIVMLLNVGQIEKLEVRNVSGEVVTKDLTWSSEKSEIAEVSGDGTIIAKKVGSTKITVKASQGVSTSCNVEVKDIPVEKVTLNKTTLNLNVNTSAELVATIEPSNAIDKKVTYSSSNNAIATVDQNGKVTGISGGTVIIIAKTSNNVSASCTVNVVLLSFNKYTISNSEIKKLADICHHENSGVEGVATEISQMCNRYEMKGYKKYKTLYSYVRNCRWWAAAKYAGDGSATKAEIEIVRKVLVEGKRVLPGYIDQHGWLGDITSVKNNGKSIDKNKSSLYKRHVTVLHSRLGSTYTFYRFARPNGKSKGDPFGYTSNAKKYRAKIGDGCYDINGNPIDGKGGSVRLLTK